MSAAFLRYYTALAPEDETALVVKQKAVLVNGEQQFHGDGTPKYTWPSMLPEKMKGEGAWYGNTGSFITERFKDGKPSASAANVEYCLVMVLDDIGTKSKAPPLAPTWIMETSEGNYQWGYAFHDDDQPKKGEFCAAITAIAAAGYTDPGATNAVRNFRLPGSINLKEGRNNFASRLVEFHPERKFNLARICAALDVVPAEADTTSGWNGLPVDDGGDDVLAWLGEQGLVLGRANGSGWLSVVCPNHAEHTDDNVEARYNPSTRTYECFHAHCTDWTSAEFLAWVAAQGGPVREPGLRDDLLTATMQKTTAALVESTGIIIDEEAFAHEYTSPAAASASLQSATLDADIEKALRLVPTETNLAIAFTHRMKGKLLYAPQRGGWVKYVGTHWQPDKLNQAFNYCVQLARSIETDSKNIKTIGKASFAGGVERIARAEPAFARSLECFDSDPDLIATPAGTLDLRNGVLRPARPEDMITRCATATLKNGKPTRWMDMLDQAFDGDAEMIQFLQDFMGYGLTGRTAAEIFVYYDGPGGNGKSTISHMQRLIMGDYFGTASPKLLLYTPTPQHATTLASLQGKRFVVDAELPVGARLDEQKLKMLTGGGAVRANFMFNDEFDFVPELKLAIEANHQPRIVRPDDAMRRRLCVVPMPKVIPNPDPLFKKHILPQEVGEIFTWMLEGAVRVLARGEKFVRPARVQEASDAYLGSQDSVGVFIAERVVQDVKQHLAQGSIYAEYQRWANDVGETYVMPAREFYSELEKKGYRRSKYGGTHVFWGVTLPSTGSGNAFPHL